MRQFPPGAQYEHCRPSLEIRQERRSPACLPAAAPLAALPPALHPAARKSKRRAAANSQQPTVNSCKHLHSAQPAPREGSSMDGTNSQQPTGGLLILRRASTNTNPAVPSSHHPQLPQFFAIPVSLGNCSSPVCTSPGPNPSRIFSCVTPFARCISTTCNTAPDWTTGGQDAAAWRNLGNGE